MTYIVFNVNLISTANHFINDRRNEGMARHHHDPWLPD
jgi:hypothetical protein